MITIDEMRIGHKSNGLIYLSDLRTQKIYKGRSHQKTETKTDVM